MWSNINADLQEHIDGIISASKKPETEPQPETDNKPRKTNKPA